MTIETFTIEKLDQRLQKVPADPNDITPSWIIAKRYFMSHKSEKIKGIIDNLLVPRSPDKKNQIKKKLGDILENLVEEFMSASQIFKDVSGQKTSPRHKLYQLDHICIFKDFVHDELKRTYGNNLTNTFIGESKNYGCDKIDVTVVYKHIGIKIFNQTTFGAIFSRLGITGSLEQKTAARGVLERFTHQDPRSISVVFSDKDWKFLRERPELFGPILIKKMIDLKTSREPQDFDHTAFADKIDNWI